MSAQPKHTPGPWKIQIMDATTNGHYVTLKITQRGDDFATDVVLDACMTKTNANLIAAAPDMAEALKAIIFHPGISLESGEAVEAMDKAAAALAKAGAS